MEHTPPSAGASCITSLVYIVLLLALMGACMNVVLK
jgi:hypothetical protein